MSTSNIRSSMNIINEAINEKDFRPVDKNKDVKTNIETLARQVGARGKYFFNKGFMTFQDILNNPNSYIEKYRKESQTDTSKLVELLKGLRENPKYTDKEHYFRLGFEARGFSNNFTTLVWFKEKKEELIIFARSREELMAIRDFLLFFRVISDR